MKKVADQVLETGVTLSVGDLTGLSPSVRNEILNHLRKKKRSVTMEEIEDEDSPKERTLWAHELPSTMSTFLAQELPADQRENVPDNGIVISDPVVQYHMNLLEGETPKQIVMAEEAQPLRSIYPKINGVREIECVCDSGSQIVSMSEETAKELHLSYNPGIIVYMQSANKTSEPTLGVAENVPFTFGSLTVYLQVHVIRKAAYKVLLGRPFECLMESVTSNHTDGSATITLTHPQTKKRIVMNTHERGSRDSARENLELNEGF